MQNWLRWQLAVLAAAALAVSACETFVEEAATFTPGPTVPVIITQPGVPVTGATETAEEPTDTAAAPTPPPDTPTTTAATPTSERTATPTARTPTPVGTTATPAEATPTQAASPSPTEATPTPTVVPASPTREASPTPEVNATALIDRGERIYTNNCSFCHQANGEGTGTFPALAGNPTVTAEDPTPVIRQVLYGGGGMPAFAGQLSNEEVAAVVSYIRNAWENDASVVTPGQVAAVREEGE